MSEQSLSKDQFSYVRHLQLDRLLSSMQQIPPHREEHLFIPTHHALEIWFKHIIFDLRRIIPLIEAARLVKANWLLKRMMGSDKQMLFRMGRDLLHRGQEPVQ